VKDYGKYIAVKHMCLDYSLRAIRRDKIKRNFRRKNTLENLLDIKKKIKQLNINQIFILKGFSIDKVNIYFYKSYIPNCRAIIGILTYYNISNNKHLKCLSNFLL